MSTSVFVSGATGYIAQHIVKQLISKGYKVVGTVRSAAKGDKLKQNLNSENFSYEIVEDIAVKGAFDEALKAHPEVTVFLHTASPFHFNVVDIEKDLLLPAVEGTKNALSAVKTFGPQIEKVVVTSSYAAILTMEKQTKEYTYSEEDWNEITWEQAKGNPVAGYIGSKSFAEKAAWDFVKTEKPHFILSTVNPVYVFGPQAFDSEVAGTLNTSAEIINTVLKLNPDSEIPSTSGFYIDVRDVAEAHLVAFENKDAQEQRLLLSDGKFASQDILDIVNEEFAEDVAGKIPVGKPNTGSEITSASAAINNDKTRKLIGHPFIGLRETVVDTIKQILNVNGKL